LCVSHSCATVGRHSLKPDTLWVLPWPWEPSLSCSSPRAASGASLATASLADYCLCYGTGSGFRFRAGLDDQSIGFIKQSSSACVDKPSRAC
jgi:hypothetical protein